jgi:hypothetical protein
LRAKVYSHGNLYQQLRSSPLNTLVSIILDQETLNKAAHTFRALLVKFWLVKEVVIYTDGGCDPNPGPGGYGVVLIYGGRRRELSGGYRLSTNNRMELMAAIKGLEALSEPCKVTLYSDSNYLVQAMNKGWAK